MPDPKFPKLITQIADRLKIKFKQQPEKQGANPLQYLKTFHREGARYAWKDGKLLGLNLTSTQLTDDKWKAVMDIIEDHFPYIQMLNLSDNQLTEVRLPEKMTSMKWINLDENPNLEFPPLETVVQGHDATLRILKSAQSQGIDEVYEVKMLIVGEGGVGKTTLWNKLQNPKHPVPDPKQKSTIGIGIKEGWKFPHPNVPGKEFLVNLWDFGGQEIQYMTHQFFLTRRSLYVLLANMRKEVGNFPYWFKIIDLLGCEEKEMEEGETPERMPILVVLNEWGTPITKLPYDQESIKEDFLKLDVIKYELDFAKDDFRLKNLIPSVQEILASRLPHLPLKMPRKWNEVRKAIYEERKRKNHISFERFKAICGEKQLKDEKEIKDLSQLLHDLGVLIHFQENLQLFNFIILKPQWAANAVYEVLNHVEELKETQGRFQERLLKDVWDKKGYSTIEQGHLMSLMLKDNLEVCFETRENGRKIFIAPQLLPKDKPKFDWQLSPDTMQYTYQYPFMPKGLIGRSIVRLHENLEDQDGKKVLWEKGMLLKIGQSKALVRQTKDEQSGGDIIRIEVQGGSKDQQVNLLHKIRTELSFIHRKSFPSLKFQEWLPCTCTNINCSKETEPHLFELDELKNWENDGLKEIPCMKGRKNVLIRATLEAVLLEERKGPEKYMKTASDKLKVFFSYSRKDQEYLETFKGHLSVLRRQGLIEAWDNSKLLPGEEWDDKIKTELAEADIILVLLSSDALNTDYIWDVELKEAMARDARNEARVIPIFVRPCDWESIELAKNNGLPGKGSFITESENEDRAWLEVVKGVKKVIQNLNNQEA